MKNPPYSPETLLISTLPHSHSRRPDAHRDVFTPTATLTWVSEVGAPGSGAQALLGLPELWGELVEAAAAMGCHEHLESPPVILLFSPPASHPLRGTLGSLAEESQGSAERAAHSHLWGLKAAAECRQPEEADGGAGCKADPTLDSDHLLCVHLGQSLQQHQQGQCQDGKVAEPDGRE